MLRLDDIMSAKSKGTNAEREVIHMFWKNGWAALRCAGSGSIRYPVPDIVAGNNLRHIAIECKSTSAERQYISKKEISDLLEFANLFGCEAWIGVRFDGGKWYFFSCEDLKETENSFVIGLAEASLKGLLFEEMIRTG